MRETDSGPSLLGTVVAVVVGGLLLWLVWGLLSAVFALVKVVLTLVVLGVVVWGVSRLFSRD